jgi:hypothetical protein
MLPILVPKPFHRPGPRVRRHTTGGDAGLENAGLKDGQTVRLVSRQGRDPADIVRLPARTLTLAGELCVFEQQFVSQFHLITDARC